MIAGIQEFLKLLGESLLAIIKVVLLSKLPQDTGTPGKEKELVILGNGPSLNPLLDKHRRFLVNKDLICVNYFPTTPLYEDLKPSIFITSAPEFWLDGIDQVYLDGSKTLFESLAKKTSWPLLLFIPFAARKNKHWQEVLGVNPLIKIVFYNETGIEGWKWLTFFLFRKRLAMPRPHNVLSPAIFTAMNLGYKTVWLWGADHNQFLELSVDENNVALINQRHFYDFSSSSPDVMRKMGTGRRKVHEILEKFVLAFKAYHILQEYAGRNQVKIYNSSPGSLIDAFERRLPDTV